MAQSWPARSMLSTRSLIARALATSSGRCSSRASTSRSAGLLDTGSEGRAPASFWDCLCPGGVGEAGCEAVGHRRETVAVLVGWVFGPLVPVEPHLGGVGEVAADLEDPGPERAIEDVEVVGFPPPLLLDEVVADHTRPG